MFLHQIEEASRLKRQTASLLKEEQVNPVDSATMDIPLMIRMFEYAREDAKTDMDIHRVTENIIRLSATGKILTMREYDEIIGGSADV
tara:strand:+ start:521 stop:784 length:264 start_codon:yes stop_codon:yes gene_type:complete